jgi:catechol 2,3-dioxygenase-like lactoylglutathione lyase family enzyme
MIARVMFLLGLLGAVAAVAGEPITPVAPQFVALSVADAPASARWYQEAFGLRVLDDFKLDDGGHIFILKSDALLVEIVQIPIAKSPGADGIKNPHLTHGIFKVGFHVADLDGAVARLRAMKAEFETGIIDDAKHGLRFALLRDPQGNYVQLFGTPKRTHAKP